MEQNSYFWYDRMHLHCHQESFGMGFLNLFRHKGPKIKVQSAKRDGLSGWLKCSGCGETLHANELMDNYNACPKCNYHYRLTVAQRLKLLVDDGTFQELFTDIRPSDPLKFEDIEKYTLRLERAVAKTGRDEAVSVGECLINGNRAALGIMDFSFMGGSMGSVVGERLTRLIEHAIVSRLPVIIVSASGGARMQESIYSLMQMAKTSAALAKLSEAKLPFISVITNPTTGGVTASFASLGDVILAEPGALFGFTGPRVIERTFGKKLPKGAQLSEFLQEKGMVDMVVSRKEMKEKIAFFIEFLRVNQEKIPKKTFLQSIRSESEPYLKLKKFLAAAVGSGK